MNKTWLVIKNEYLKHVRRKRFILALLSMPLFIVLMVGVGMLSVVITYNDTPVGYVDNSSVFTNAIMPELDSPVPLRQPLEIISFDNETTARKALDEGSIQAYYVIPENYLETGRIKATANKMPDGDVNDQFKKFLQVNLLSSYSDEITNRVLEGAEIETKALDQNQASSFNIISLILPLVAGILFMLTINISGGYLLQAVVEEKENRTMEIIITSLSPTQLMAGKVIGNLSVGLTQMIVWIIFGIIGVIFAARTIPEIQLAQIDPTFLVIMILTFLPAFVMIAAMMATLGATATEAKEAQQIAGLFTLPIVIPFWFIQVLMESPNSPLSIALSLFPFTAPISLPLRAAFTNVPSWQIIMTISLLVLIAFGALWLSGRAFRLGMLRYGKRLTIKELFTRPIESKA